MLNSDLIDVTARVSGPSSNFYFSSFSSKLKRRKKKIKQSLLLKLRFFNKRYFMYRKFGLLSFNNPVSNAKSYNRFGVSKKLDVLNALSSNKLVLSDVTGNGSYLRFKNFWLRKFKNRFNFYKDRSLSFSRRLFKKKIKKNIFFFNDSSKFTSNNFTLIRKTIQPDTNLFLKLKAKSMHGKNVAALKNKFKKINHFKKSSTVLVKKKQIVVKSKKFENRRMLSTSAAAFAHKKTGKQANKNFFFNKKKKITNFKKKKSFSKFFKRRRFMPPRTMARKF